jgi:hypothetical protein
VLFFESSQKKESDKRFLGIDHGDGDNRGTGGFFAGEGWLTQAGVLEITTRMVPQPRSELCLAGSHVVPHSSPAVPGSDGPTGSPSPSLLCHARIR